MRFFTLLAAPLAITASVCTDKLSALFLGNLWLLNPTNPDVAGVCTDGGAAFGLEIQSITDACGAGLELPELDSMMQVVNDVLCKEKNGDYCLTSLLSIVPTQELLAAYTSGNWNDLLLNWKSYLTSPEKVALACKSKWCTRKILTSATKIARDITRANSWEVGSHIDDVRDVVRGLVRACPSPECTGNTGKHFDFDTDVLGADACTGGKMSQCAKKLLSNEEGLATTQKPGKSCPNAGKKEKVGKATLTLPNLLFDYIQDNPDLAAMVLSYLPTDLAFLMSMSDSDLDIADFAVLADQLTLGDIKKTYMGVSIDIDFMALVGEHENLTELIEAFQRIVTGSMPDAEEDEEMPMFNLDMLVPDDAFRVPASLTAGGAELTFAEEMTPTASTPTADDDAGNNEESSAASAGVGAGALLALLAGL